ncbi:interleukin-10 [Rhinophrynus dorsalis]
MNFCLLLTLLIFTCREVICQSGDAEGSCQRVAHIFPAKLKELRTTFQKVKDFFQMNDNTLDTVLLQDDLLEEFKGTMGCQSVSEMIRFYLEDVIPRAKKTNNDFQINVNFMKDKLQDLRSTLRRCHHFLPCDRKSKTIKKIKETYSKMREQGIYKAMGEFDIFIDYIEQYLMSKKK